MQGAVDKVSGPKDLFQALYHHFLCLADSSLHITPASGGPALGTRGTAGPLANLAGGSGGVDGERILCVRAMVAVYAKHAVTIGMCACSTKTITDVCCSLVGKHACIRHMLNA